jgi:uncharacterized membrane protein
MLKRTHELTLAAVIAAAYVVLTLPFAQFSFGIIQFRLAEAMTVLAVLSPAAIPGLTIGCLMSNLLNPNNLGPVDIFGGSLATFLAALLSWKLSVNYRKSGRFSFFSTGRKSEDSFSVSQIRLNKLVLMVSPAVFVNAVIVGTYLPYLLIGKNSAGVAISAVFLSIASIFLCEAVVVYLIGIPLLLGLRRTRLKNIF